jgi:hypothetical protein
MSKTKFEARREVQNQLNAVQYGKYTAEVAEVRNGSSGTHVYVEKVRNNERVTDGITAFTLSETEAFVGFSDGRLHFVV